MSLGTSPFIGAGQFGPLSADYYKRFYLNPLNMEEIIIKSVELGVPAVQAIAYERIIQAIKHVQDKLQVKGITVGITSIHEAEETFEQAKKFWSAVG